MTAATVTVWSPATADLPLLTRGRHLHPTAGACLLEYTSMLAGRRFSDRPRCTAPVLSILGRLVNDTVSDDARHSLILLAPDLAGRPHATAGTTASVVAGVLSDVASAVAARPGDSRRRRTARWLQTNAGWESRRAGAANKRRSAWWVQLSAVAHRNGVARWRLEYAIRATAVLDPADRDRLLVCNLTMAVASVPTGAGAAGTREGASAPERGPVPAAGFGQQVVDMGLDGGHGDEQPAGDVGDGR